MLPAHGFKEWSLVCDALGDGAQSLILRKGGIHEGRGGFTWRHDRFFLFPTGFHEQAVQFPRPGATERPHPEAAPHTLRHFATVDFLHGVEDRAAIERLRPFHFWSDDVVRERFDYTGRAGLSAAFVRVFELSAPWTIPDERRFGGCRSWLELPEPPREMTLSPVLSDARHAARRADVRAALKLD